MMDDMNFSFFYKIKDHIQKTNNKYITNFTINNQ